MRCLTHTLLLAIAYNYVRHFDLRFVELVVLALTHLPSRARHPFANRLSHFFAQLPLLQYHCIIINWCHGFAGGLINRNFLAAVGQCSTGAIDGWGAERHLERHLEGGR